MKTYKADELVELKKTAVKLRRNGAGVYPVQHGGAGAEDTVELVECDALARACVEAVPIDYGAVRGVYDRVVAPLRWRGAGRINHIYRLERHRCR